MLLRYQQAQRRLSQQSSPRLHQKPTNVSWRCGPRIIRVLKKLLQSVGLLFTMGWSSTSKGTKRRIFLKNTGIFGRECHRYWTSSRRSFGRNHRCLTSLILLLVPMTWLVCGVAMMKDVPGLVLLTLLAWLAISLRLLT